MVEIILNAAALICDCKCGGRNLWLWMIVFRFGNQVQLKFTKKKQRIEKKNPLLNTLRIVAFCGMIYNLDENM